MSYQWEETKPRIWKISFAIVYFHPKRQSQVLLGGWSPSQWGSRSNKSLVTLNWYSKLILWSLSFIYFFFLINMCFVWFTKKTFCSIRHHALIWLVPCICFLLWGFSQLLLNLRDDSIFLIFTAYFLERNSMTVIKDHAQRWPRVSSDCPWAQTES